MIKAVVTVLGGDRTGIIAGISTFLYENDINILDISQTILDGTFTMAMMVDIERAQASFTELTRGLAALGERLGVTVRMQREEIFDAMHRV